MLLSVVAFQAFFLLQFFCMNVLASIIKILFSLRTRGWQGFLAYGCQNLVTVIEPKSVQVSFTFFFYLNQNWLKVFERNIAFFARNR